VQPAASAQARPEATESVAKPLWMSRDTMLEWVQLGWITCAVTLAAFTVASTALERLTLPDGDAGHAPPSAMPGTVAASAPRPGSLTPARLTPQ
jgi:hypothetical protein